MAQNRLKYAKELEKELGISGSLSKSHKKAVTRSNTKSKLKGPSQLAKFSMQLAKARRKAATAAKMAYYGKGYHAAKTGVKPKKAKMTTTRTKAIERGLSSALSKEEIARLRGKK